MTTWKYGIRCDYVRDKSTGSRRGMVKNSNGAVMAFDDVDEAIIEMERRKRIGAHTLVPLDGTRNEKFIFAMERFGPFWLVVYFVGIFLIGYILEIHGIHVCQGIEDELCR